MNLWVDDLRQPPEGWDWARSSSEALAMLKANIYQVMSLDHDLGGDDTTRTVVLHLAEFGNWPDEVRVHTANPPGRYWLEGMINRYGPGVSHYTF